VRRVEEALSEEALSEEALSEGGGVIAMLTLIPVFT